MEGATFSLLQEFKGSVKCSHRLPGEPESPGITNCTQPLRESAPLSFQGRFGLGSSGISLRLQPARLQRSGPAPKRWGPRKVRLEDQDNS